MDPMSLLLGGGILGGLAYGGYSAQNSLNKKQMRFNARQAALQRSWMERMSNTAHQRQVQDLRKAGLNPILSAGGSGAQVGTPSAAQISGLKSPFAAGMDGVDSAIKGFSSIASVGADLERLGLDKDMNPAKIATEISQQRLNDARAAEAIDRVKDGDFRRRLMIRDADLRYQQKRLAYEQSVDTHMARQIKGLQYDELFHSWCSRVDEAKARVKKILTETGRIKSETEREKLGYWLDIVDRGLDFMDIFRRFKGLTKVTSKQNIENVKKKKVKIKVKKY